MTNPRSDHDSPARAPRRQVIIMFALFLTGMLGLLGLALDLGFAFSAKRTVQNAADAGAMAGARAVTKWTTTNGYSAGPDVSDIVDDINNQMSGSIHSLVSCEYVNDADSSVGACSSSVPASATGVRVVVSEVVNTFFIQVVPGAPDTVTVEATSTAHVQAVSQGPSDGPFIVCGMQTKLDSGGAKLSILLDNNTFNTAAFGQTFQIHGPWTAVLSPATSKG